MCAKSKAPERLQPSHIQHSLNLSGEKYLAQSVWLWLFYLALAYFCILFVLLVVTIVFLFLSGTGNPAWLLEHGKRTLCH
jgi:hypothetical protein